MDKIKGTFGRRVGKKKDNVSPAVIRRLPRYHRFLGELLKQDKLRISSSELSCLMGVTASQIRQDLNCFGEFGQQGYGYNIRYLHKKIGELLGVNREYNAVILGAGNLGKALISSHMFERRGVNRLAMFDINPEIIGKTVAGIPVYSMDDLPRFCAEHQVDIGVLTTPKDAAVAVAKTLAELGVPGIWNFSSNELSLEGTGTIVENVHMGDSLMLLTYRLKAEKDEADK
ncbi:MAG: redox-sensing transcriptional repressor Rex [Clostridia bacterium]|nr:redox-sensing transcriptional repressor Rex [Clostridia bacterium]